MSSPSSSSAPTTNKANSTQSRTDKLKQLAKLRVDSAAANRKQVALEFQASKTGHTKGAAKEARKREEALKLLSEKEALAAGLDYERLKNLDYSMDDVDRWTAKLEAKKDMADNGFTDYIQIAAKAYTRRIRDLKPDQAAYEAQKDALDADPEDSAYKAISHAPSDSAKIKLAEEMKAQRKRNSTRSKRRMHDDTEDVTYINDKNAHFNRKLARTYDRFTGDIKTSLERGTAL